MDWKRIIIGLCVMACLMPSVAVAQSDDFGVWTSLSAKKKLAKGVNLSAEAEYRTRDGLKNSERWAGNIGVDVRLLPWLKADAGYTYIYQNNPTETTKKGNIVPSYWYSRHRVTASLTGSVKWNRLEFSLRERWQYTYRPEKTVPKFDDDGVTPKDDEVVKGKGKNVLRSRLQVEYNIAKKCPFTPFASCELYHSGDGLDKTRWTVGTEYKISKKHTVEVYYRYQNRADEDEADNHVLGLGYTFKF